MPAYGTLNDADEYHQARGNTEWIAADESARDVALLRGSEFVDRRHRHAFPGRKTGGRAQVREWPRVYASTIDGENIDSDEVPLEVEHAAYEAALRELQQPGSLAPDYVPAQQVKRQRVEGAVEVEYRDTASPDASATIVPIIAEILAPVLSAAHASPLSGSLVRV